MSKDKLPFFRTPYNYDRNEVSRATGTFCEDPSLANQQFKYDSDPNTIVATYARTRDESLLKARNPTYGDFTGAGSYQECLNRVIAAQDDFFELPSALRSRFGNDPAQLLDFISDPDNFDEALKLGLLKAELSTPASPTAGKAGVDKPPQATPPAKRSSASKKAVSEAPADVPADAE